MSGIKTVVTNRLTWLSVAFVVVFYFLTQVLSVANLGEASRTALVTFCFMGLPVYVTEAVLAYKQHRWPNRQLLAALGVCLILTGLAFGGLLSMLWRFADYRIWIVANDTYSFTIALVALGVFILVTTPNLFGRDVPPAARVRLGFSWVLAAAFIVGLTAFSPDLTWLAMTLKPVLAPSHTP